MEELNFFNKILAECSGTPIIEDALHNVLQEVMKTTGFEGSAICFLNEDNTLTLSAQEGLSEKRVRDLITKKSKLVNVFAEKALKMVNP